MSFQVMNKRTLLQNWSCFQNKTSFMIPMMVLILIQLLFTLVSGLLFIVVLAIIVSGGLAFGVVLFLGVLIFFETYFLLVLRAYYMQVGFLVYLLASFCLSLSLLSLLIPSPIGRDILYISMCRVFIIYIVKCNHVLNGMRKALVTSLCNIQYFPFNFEARWCLESLSLHHIFGLYVILLSLCMYPYLA